MTMISLDVRRWSFFATKQRKNVGRTIEGDSKVQENTWMAPDTGATPKPHYSNIRAHMHAGPQPR